MLRLAHAVEILAGDGNLQDEVVVPLGVSTIRGCACLEWREDLWISLGIAYGHLI